MIIMAFDSTAKSASVAVLDGERVLAACGEETVCGSEYRDFVIEKIDPYQEVIVEVC